MLLSRSRTILSPSLAAASKAHIFTWVENVFNRVDRGRILREGPDRVASEYVLRMTGELRLKDRPEWIVSMSELPDGPVQLTEVNMKGSTVTDVGMEHFKDLESLRKLDLSDCQYFTDNGLENILRLELKELDLSGTKVSTQGASRLVMMKTLEQLGLRRMSKINKQEMESLKQLYSAQLPSCKLITE